MQRAVLGAQETQREALDGWSEEDAIWRARFQRWSHRRNVRAQLSRAVREGYLERKPFRQHRTLSIVALSDEGEQALRARYTEAGHPAPFIVRYPRPDHIEHHLLAVEASLHILKNTQSQFLRLMGDEDLRSQLRAGTIFEAGHQEERALPDGRLFLQNQQGRRHSVDIEIFVSNYTDEQIQAKYEALKDLNCQFYAPGQAFCDRVEGLTGVRPHQL